MTIRWEDTLSDGLAQFAANAAADVKDSLAAGGELIVADAKARAPKVSGELASTGRVRKDRGGNATVGLYFAGPYARWVHEHLNFKHPFGGQPKFLETAMLTKGGDALAVAGEKLWRRG